MTIYTAQKQSREQAKKEESRARQPCMDVKWNVHCTRVSKRTTKKKSN